MNFAGPHSSKHVCTSVEFPRRNCRAVVEEDFFNPQEKNHSRTGEDEHLWTDRCTGSIIAVHFRTCSGRWGQLVLHLGNAELKQRACVRARESEVSLDLFAQGSCSCYPPSPCSNRGGEKTYLTLLFRAPTPPQAPPPRPSAASSPPHPSQPPCL